MFIYWNDVEPAPGDWQWSLFDQRYEQILAAGLRPLIVALGSPCWTRPRTKCDQRGFGPPDPSYDPKWSEFVQQLAARYRSAIGIEVWNEPNLVQFFLPRVDPVRYTQLLREAYEAVKRVQSQMSVISGGLAENDAAGVYSGGEGDAAFLRAMYANGAGAAMDAIGVHIYPTTSNHAPHATHWNPAGFEQGLNRLRMVRAWARTAQPFWITEAGEATANEAGYPLAVTPRQQAAALVTMVKAAERDRDVGMMLIDTLDDAPASVARQQIDAGLGIFDSNGAAKPAACALAREFGGRLTCPR